MKDDNKKGKAEPVEAKPEMTAREERQKAIAEDQRMLSAFLMAINPGGEMTNELMRWWMSRY